MYVPSLRFGFAQRVHVFSQSLNLLEHHKMLVTILVVMGVMGLASALHPPVEHWMVTPDPEQPLTRLDDPQYAPEYATRAQHINASLERLRNETLADRVYAVSYDSGPAPFGNAPALKVSKTFEVGLTRFAPQFCDFRNFPREHWLSLMRANQLNSGLMAIPLSRSLGMELEDRQGKPIGYLGIEYLQETSSLQGNERDLFQQTAALIEAALLQPIDALTSRAEN